MNIKIVARRLWTTKEVLPSWRRSCTVVFLLTSIKCDFSESFPVSIFLQTSGWWGSWRWRQLQNKIDTREEPAQPCPPLFRAGFGCWFIFALVLMVFRSSLYHNVALHFRAALVWVHCMFWVVINHHLYKMWNKEILKWTAQRTFFYIFFLWNFFEAVAGFV